MAYENLKAAIKQAIKQNGNQEITGNLLQSTLLNVVNTIGADYKFLGFATPSTVPPTSEEGNLFYFAIIPGNYSNFKTNTGNLVITIENGVFFFTKNATDSYWSSNKIFEIVQITGEAEDKVMSQKATSTELNKKFDKASIAKESGDAEDKVMSQKAVSTKLSELVKSLKDEFSYKGIAQPTTNPGVPDSNVFYIAGEGTYTNFSNLIIEAGQLGILKWDGSWHKEVLEIGTGGGNMILNWNTDVATTRKQVLSKYRKSGVQISYKDSSKGWINEQYTGITFTDTEWEKDTNWKQIAFVSQLNKSIEAIEQIVSVNSNTISDNKYSINVLESAEMTLESVYLSKNGEIIASGSSKYKLSLITLNTGYCYSIDSNNIPTYKAAVLNSKEDFKVGGVADYLITEETEFDLRSSTAPVYLAVVIYYNSYSNLSVDSSIPLYKETDANKSDIQAIHKKNSDISTVSTLLSSDFQQLDDNTIISKVIDWENNQYCYIDTPSYLLNGMYYQIKVQRAIKNGDTYLLLNEKEDMACSIGISKHVDSYFRLKIQKVSMVMGHTSNPINTTEFSVNGIKLNMYESSLPNISCIFSPANTIKAEWDTYRNEFGTPNENMMHTVFVPISSRKIKLGFKKKADYNSYTTINVIAYRPKSKGSSVTLKTFDITNSFVTEIEVPNEYSAVALSSSSREYELLYIGYEDIDVYEKPKRDQTSMFGPWSLINRDETITIRTAVGSSICLDCRDIAYVLPRFYSVERVQNEASICWFSSIDQTKMTESIMYSVPYCAKQFRNVIKVPYGAAMCILPASYSRGGGATLIYKGEEEEFEKSLYNIDGYNGNDVSINPMKYDHYISWRMIAPLPTYGTGTQLLNGQGAAVYGDYLISGQGSGTNNVDKPPFFILCSHLDGRFIALMRVENALDELWHAGSMSFTRQFYDVNDEFPLIIIGGNHDAEVVNTNPYALNVCRIYKNENGEYTMTRIQKILLNFDGYFFPEILGICNDKKVLYLSAHKNDKTKTQVFKTTLPDYSDIKVIESEITITRDDVTYLNEIPYLVMRQDGTFYNGKLYLLKGSILGSYQYGGSNPSNEALGFYVFDGESGELLNKCDFRRMPFEPEGIDVYNGEMVLTTLRPTYILRLRFEV